MSELKVIQHSDRVEFRTELQSLLDEGWYPVQLAISSMRADDLHIAILEYYNEVDEDAEGRLEKIADIIAGKERRNLTNADFEAIRALSGV